VRDISLSRDNSLSPTKGLGPFSRDVKSDYYGVAGGATVALGRCERAIIPSSGET
jgi:hypothetical protein